MDHATLIGRITGLADARGLLWHFCGDPRRCTGPRGLPDLLIAGPGGLAFIEAKTGGQLEPEQQAWRDMLNASGAAWHRFDPADLWTGAIQRVLDELAAL